MQDIDYWRRRLVRKASRLLPASTAPVDPVTSWFGRVTLAEPGEDWPTCGGRLLWPLLQIAVRELPFRPPALRDVALIRVFVDPAFTGKMENGGADFYAPDPGLGPGWLLRAATTLDGIVPLVEPAHGSPIKPCPVQWERIETDYPTWDDLPPDFPELPGDEYGLSFETQQGTKVGGWPYTAQSEIYWGPDKWHPHSPEYVFQIDSHYELGWMWGDSGLGYFGRGTGAHRDKWAMTWQCY